MMPTPESNPKSILATNLPANNAQVQKDAFCGMLISMDETLAVANYFVQKGIAEKNPVTLMKLTKLLYFAQGLSLAYLGQPIISEAFQAWKFGPVLPSLYQQAKHYKSKEIKTLLSDDWGDILLAEHLSERQQNVLEAVWKKFGNMDAFQLSALTHIKNGPWKAVFIEGANRLIPNKLIKDFFVQEFSHAKR